MLSKRLFCAARAAMTRIPLAPHRAALSSTPNQPPLPRGDDERNLSNQAVVDSANVGYRAKLTNLWKKYGLLAVGTYFGIYFTTLGSLFLSLDYNLINPSTLGIDHTAAIHKICELVEDFTGITSLPNYIREHPQVGTFAVAYVMTKITEPARLALTIGIVPAIAKRIGKTQAAEDAATSSTSTAARSGPTDSTPNTSSRRNDAAAK